MRGRMFLASTVLLATAAWADVVINPLPAGVGPYPMVGGSGGSRGVILYDNTTETGFRYNASAAGTTIPADNRRVAFDDVPIPNARLGGNTHVAVTRVTVGLRRLANAPATDVDVFWATCSTGPTPPDTELDVPFNLIQTHSLAVNGAAAVTTQLVSGDGTNTLFTVPLNSTLFSGFGTFLIGMRITNTDINNGWRLTSGPDANANVFWQYDPGMTGQPNPEGAFLFSTANPPNPLAAFWIRIEGTPIPEPAGLGLLALGALAALRRRW